MSKLHDLKRRETKPWRKWYGRKEWKQRAARCLQADPVCMICHKARSTIADHIEPHRGDWTKFWHGPLQGLCKRCHDSVKQSLEKKPRQQIGRDGWPINPKK